MKYRIITLSLVSLLLFPQLAFANYWAGGDVVSAPSNIQGASSTISYYARPYVTSLWGDFSCAWSAIGNDTYGYIAQAGWAYEPSKNSTTRYFFGWINSNGLYNEDTSLYGPALGSKHTYWVELNPTTRAVVGYVDGSLISTKTIDWTPDAVQYSGEHLFYDSHMPGSYSQVSSFSNLTFRNGNTGTWMKPSINRWFNEAESGINATKYSTEGWFGIWDWRS